MFRSGAYLRSTKKNNYLNVFIANRVPPQLTEGKGYHNTHNSLTLCFMIRPPCFDPAGSSSRKNHLVNTNDICIAFAWFLHEDDPVGSRDVGGTDADRLTQFQVKPTQFQTHEIVKENRKLNKILKARRIFPSGNESDESVMRRWWRINTVGR
jgi:hypothetical protein